MATRRATQTLLVAAGAVLVATIVRHRSIRCYRGRVVVITGGSRGLGLEMARCWGETGARLALCARTARDLEVAAAELRGCGYQVVALPCDVTDPAQVAKFVNEVIRRWGRIDVLVNNAGIIQAGPFEAMTLEDFRRTMDTHFWGPLHMIDAALSHLRRAGRGQIVNIASIGGEISVPHLLPYSASKFALVGLSQGLHAELRQQGIHVTTVCPGLMRTGSPRNAEFKGNHRAEYAWFSISDSLPLVSINARRAARQIVAAAARRQAYLAVSLPAKLGIRLHGMLPGLSAVALALVNRLLPRSREQGKLARTGKESYSRWSPSILTTLNEQAASRNNELD